MYVKKIMDSVQSEYIPNYHYCTANEMLCEYYIPIPLN